MTLTPGTSTPLHMNDGNSGPFSFGDGLLIYLHAILFDVFDPTLLVLLINNKSHFHAPLSLPYTAKSTTKTKPRRSCASTLLHHKEIGVMIFSWSFGFAFYLNFLLSLLACVVFDCNPLGWELGLVGLGVSWNS